MCFPLARQSKRKGNALSASTSFPGKIPLPSSVRGEKSTLISSWHIMQLQPRSLKVRSPEYILRTRRHTYRPLGPYPCSFTTIDHVRGNSLKATVASLHPALGGRLQILTDERQSLFAVEAMRGAAVGAISYYFLFWKKRREGINTWGEGRRITERGASATLPATWVAAPTQSGGAQIGNRVLFLILNFSAEGHPE